MITVATWNISAGISYPWDIEKTIPTVSDYESYGIFEELVDSISARKIDILCLQESVMGFGQESIAFKASNLSECRYFSEYPLSECHLLKNAKMGVAILSRFPILYEERVLFPNPRLSIMGDKLYTTHDKGFLQVDIAVPCGSLTAISAHAAPFSLFHKSAGDYTSHYLPLIEKMNCLSREMGAFIIAGDLNTDRFEELFPCAHDFAFSCIDSPTSTNGKRVDYILASKSLVMRKSEVFKTKSDHHLCLASFE